MHIVDSTKEGEQARRKQSKPKKRNYDDSDEDSEEESSHQSLKGFWLEKFKKEGLEKDAIKPNFDVFT